MNQRIDPSRRFALIGVPSSAGARLAGQEDGPGALRAAGLVRNLEKLGVSVTDRGDLPRVVFRPDPENPTRQNRGLVRSVAGEVAGEVEAASRGGALPLVLGGDCTITLGVVSGLLEEGSSLGLVYLDGDLDLNTPETTPSGIFDGMVTAHLFGQGDPELARLGRLHPLLEESHLLYFGYNESDGGIDPPELDKLEASAALRVSLDAIRDRPAAAARRALATLEGRVERILVHFDVDVTNTPAVDVVHPSGLSLESAIAALEVFSASPRLAGLVVTELNPARDPSGSFTTRLAHQLAEALRAAGRPAAG